MILDKNIGIMVGHAMKLAHDELLKYGATLAEFDDKWEKRTIQILDMNVKIQKEILDKIKDDLKPQRRLR